MSEFAIHRAALNGRSGAGVRERRLRCAPRWGAFDTSAAGAAPNRTASRDLSDLVAKEIIKPLPGGGRTTRYELIVVEPAGFGLEKE